MNYYECALTRFNKFVKVRSGKCWEWTGALDTNGYGTFWYNGGAVSAHKFSYEAYNGVVTNGLWVLHKCNNSLCVSPYHLYLGTPHDNCVDCAKAGNAGNRFTEEQVRMIRCLRRERLSVTEIGELFDAPRTTISGIVHKRTYSWIV